MKRSKTLLVVESPAKARTIQRYLGKGYDVVASMGHVKDLPKNKLGVRIDHDFEPEFQVIKGKERILKEIKKRAKQADTVILATDPDREGEAIGWHIAQEIDKLKKPIKRIWLKAITKKSLLEALEEPRDIDHARVEAQFTRRILDRLVGYSISPILWDKIWQGLSAGRVQSVALKLIVEREKEIEAFVPKEYWRVRALLSTEKDEQFWAKLVRSSGEKIEIPDGKKAEAIVKQCRKAEWVVVKVERKRKKQNPQPPFQTARLQQEAVRRFRWPATKTMRIAQRLYEGVDLPDGRVGLITYMRTDSIRVSDEAIATVRRYIDKTFGKEYLPSKPKKYQASKGSQDAHEAIRPTDVSRTPESLRPYLSEEEYRLYDMIWRRFVASQMTPAEFDVTTVVVGAGGYEFEARGEVLIKPGFLIVEQPSRVDNGKNGDEKQRLPKLEKGQKLRLVDIESTQHFTQPPPRYTEASLIRELEKRKIGRPSTYATIVSIIQNRDYVQKINQAFRPTALGRLVAELLDDFFKDIMDYGYTAKMEKALDNIEKGKTNRITLLKKFFKRFSQELEKAKNDMPSVKAGVVTEYDCPKCGSKLILRWSRNGGFLYCSSESCTFKTDYEAFLHHEEDDEPDDSLNCPVCDIPMEPQSGPHGAYYQCPSCQLSISKHPEYPLIRFDRSCSAGHSPLVLKRGPYGYFYACVESECRDTSPVFLDLPCLEKDCDGEIVLRSYRRGKRIRTFYGCSKYPECRFAFSNAPVREPCPTCGALYQTLVRGKPRCVNPSCPTAIKPRRYSRSKKKKESVA